MTLGFSTGALAGGDFRAALDMLDGKAVSAIELSALREHELDPLLEWIESSDVGDFRYIAVHAPSRFSVRRETEVARLLQSRIPVDWKIVVHPDSLGKPSAWQPFGARLLIENMDKRKRSGRTWKELAPLFDALPEASLCLDLAHIRQVDPTMSQAVQLIRAVGSRLAQIHISDIDGNGNHLPLSAAAIYAFQQVAPLLAQRLPVIIESVVDPMSIEQELASARRALRVPAAVLGNVRA